MTHRRLARQRDAHALRADQREQRQAAVAGDDVADSRATLRDLAAANGSDPVRTTGPAFTSGAAPDRHRNPRLPRAAPRGPRRSRRGSAAWLRQARRPRWPRPGPDLPPSARPPRPESALAGPADRLAC